MRVDAYRAVQQLTEAGQAPEGLREAVQVATLKKKKNSKWPRHFSRNAAQ